MTVTRNELIAALQLRNPDMTQQKARLIVDTVIDEMANALIESDSLKIPGFGAFKVRLKTARPVRYPRSGERCEIAARRATTFRPSVKLTEAVNAHASKKEEG